MGIDDYTLSGGIDSRVEEILSTGLNATPESIQGLITELKNRKYKSDLEVLLGRQQIELLEQRLNSQEMSEVIMGYQEDLRNAISALQSRLDDLDAGEQTDLNEIQSALNTLQTTVNNLSTTVQGKASTTEVNGALALKADKTDIKDPSWGQIGGNLPDQTDLRNSLASRASVSDLAAIDTRTRTLENTITTKADQTALDAKANTVDVNAALDLKSDTSYVTQMLATKADQNALDAKANTSDVELMFTQLMPVINGKATATSWNDIEIPVNGWSASAPYTQTVTVNGMLATYNPVADIKFTDNTTIETEGSYYSCVKRITTGANSITLVCPDEKPAGTFHIRLKEVS